VTEGNLEFVEMLAYFVVVAPPTTVIVLRDEGRLRPDQRARAWPPVSRDAAIFFTWFFGFNPLAVLLFLSVHFVRTRGVFEGLDRALLWTCAVVAPGLAAIYGVDALFGSAA
jgi:hypothetical protein